VWTGEEIKNSKRWIRDFPASGTAALDAALAAVNKAGLKWSQITRKDFPLAGKSSEVIDRAFTNPAPQEGGPFVTAPGGKDAMAREPRVRVPEMDELKTISRLERRRDLLRADEQNPAAIGEKR